MLFLENIDGILDLSKIVLTQDILPIKIGIKFAYLKKLDVWFFVNLKILTLTLCPNFGDIF